MKLTSKIFVTLFGIGLFPFAPGTLASIATVIIWYFYIKIFPFFSFIILITILTILAYLLTRIYIRDIKDKDPKEIVIDEAIGQSMPLMFLNVNSDLYIIMVAFVTFRFFDIFKVYPINLSENLPGAIGIIADDIVAGIYSIIVLMIFKLLIF